MRFACLHHGDPVSEDLWSGIPLNIVRTLRELGHEVVLIGALQPHVPVFSRVKSAIYKFLFKKVYVINRDPSVIRARTPDANKRLSQLGAVDAILVSYLPDAAYLESKYPVVLLHDATWVQLLDYYPGYERSRLAAETVRGGIELDREALRRCAHAIYSSHWATRSASQDYGVPDHKLSVAPLGASIVNPPTRTDVAAYLKRRGQDTMKLFFLGKEWHRKGGDIAVQVAAEIMRLGVPVELHVAGCQPEGEIPPFVRAHGSLRKDVEAQAQKLRGLFESSDFFIMPTRADAFGIVFGESAAFGLPVMASDSGGVREAARGEWSLVPPPGTSPSIYAQWAVSLFRNRAEYERLSWLARESYENDLNWPSFCRHLIQVVSECAH